MRDHGSPLWGQQLGFWRLDLGRTIITKPHVVLPQVGVSGWGGERSEVCLLLLGQPPLSFLPSSWLNDFLPERPPRKLSTYRVPPYIMEALYRVDDI